MTIWAITNALINQDQNRSPQKLNRAQKCMAKHQKLMGNHFLEKNEAMTVLLNGPTNISQ